MPPRTARPATPAGGGQQKGQTVTSALAERGQAPPGQDQAPSTEVARRDTLDQMIDHITGAITKQLPAQIPPDYFLRTVLTGLRKNHQLAQLAVSGKRGRASIYAALLEAARFGLMPFTDEGAIVVFGQGNKAEATFIPQYKGLIQMMYRTGQVAGVEARLIHLNDDWDLAYGDAGTFYHRPLLVDPQTGEPADRGPAILAYCFIRLKGGERTSVVTLTRAEAEEIRDEYSRSYRNAEKSWDGKEPKRDSAWHTDFDSMWIKSAIRRADAPKSPQLVELLTAAARDDVRRPAAAESAARLSDFDLDEDEIQDIEVLDETPEAQQAAARQQAVTRMHALFGTYGLGGDEHRAAILVILGMLARDDARRERVPLNSSTDLSDVQLRVVVEKLEAVGRAAGGVSRPADDVRSDLLTLARAGGWEPAAPPAGAATVTAGEVPGEPA
jgi:recombination protein RecT